MIRNSLAALLVIMALQWSALADDIHLLPYGVAATVDFRILAADGTFVTNATDGGTDVTLTCDDGTPATATNDFADEGSHYSLALTATELQCKRLVVDVADTIANGFIVETYGASGQIPAWPAVAAGGSGGLLISGSNSGTTTLGALTVTGATTYTGAVTASNASNNIQTNAVKIGSQTASASGTVTFPNATLASTTNITSATGIDVTKWSGTTVATPDTAGYPKITIKDGTGTGEIDTNAGAVVSVTTAATATNLTNVPAALTKMLGQSTTIATLASQTSFTLTAGSADDNAYNGWAALVIDASTAGQTALGCVSDYTGATKTITLKADPGIYTMATSDTIVLLPSFCNVGVDVATIETVDATDQLDAHAAAGLDAAGVRTAIGLATANLDTQLDAIPTNADLATSQAAADDATLAAIAALNNLSAVDVRDLVIDDQGSGVSLGCAISVVLAYAAGDLSTTGGSSTYEDPSGTETRITGTVASAGNRTAAITCPTY